MSWAVIVPVKGRAGGKSRLGDVPDRELLAEAFALDTVAALVAASAVTRVYVVTSAGATAAPFEALGAHIVHEEHTARDPLNAAIARGLEAARRADPDADRAVFTGDLPALTPADVNEALRLAAAHERSMVADEEGTGTTVLLALAGVPMMPRFGEGSRAAHVGDGHVPLAIEATARIRRDVDTPDNLAEALRLGVGARTRAVLARVAQRSSA